MKLLAFDSSSRVGTIALIEEKDKHIELLGEWTLSIDNSFHSERLLWGIHQLLESAKTPIETVDVFAVGVGPGSFTGLRIGMTTARTIAHTLNKPLLGVSSLAALARPLSLLLRDKDVNTLVVATTDAAKGELFALWGIDQSVRECVSFKDGDFPGLWKAGVTEAVITPEDLVEELLMKLDSKSGPKKMVLMGEGRFRYPEVWKLISKKYWSESPFLFSDGVQGRFLAQLAWEGFQAGLARDALSVHPRYLRASDAEIKLKAIQATKK
ncbi:MAG: tRNA (adenosine(37)-N6)-threonylcarbamoyltransferase complex dimerization subunit type 1 TsaB [Xanthomonadaceae bacterium]|nr:tRNA (adenosine(37)-N6)-threonylcarbamoyltransferase complex dimerization subunit type 1 TsaB [Xanthomonadaceae bacterium]